MNNICIVGRITKDIEVTKTKNSLKMARFNVAVSSEFKGENGERKADFFTCVAWRETAENIAKFFKKGSPIGLVGSMTSRKYTKEDGTTQVLWELQVKNFVFINGGEQDSEGKEKGKKSVADTFIPIDDEDLPF